MQPTSRLVCFAKKVMKHKIIAQIKDIIPESEILFVFFKEYHKLFWSKKNIW